METKMTIVTWCVIGIVVAPVLVCCSVAPTSKGKAMSSSSSASNDASLNDKKMKQDSPTRPSSSSSSSSFSSSFSSSSYGQMMEQANGASAKSPGSFGPSPHPASRDRVKPTPEKPKGRGAAEDAKQGGMEPGGSPFPRKSLGSQDDDGLRYLLFGEDRRWQQQQQQQQQQQVKDGSSFSTSVPPLAMAEYLLLTGDFSGFDRALEDITAVGMMTSSEAEFYRLQVGVEYQSLLKQETEAEIEDMYDDYRKVIPTYPEAGVIDNFPLGSSFIPPFAIDYSDYGYYDNPTDDVMFGRESDFMTDESQKTPSGDYIGEILQRMIDSINEEQGGDRRAPMNSSGSSTLPSASSTSTASQAQQQQQQQQQPASGKKPAKAGKGGGAKSESGKEGARKTGKKEKGRKGGAGRGGGEGGGGKVLSSSSSSSSSSSPSSSVESLSDVGSVQPTPDTMNRELQMLTKTQNKTKEANGTKTRRPLSRQ